MSLDDLPGQPEHDHTRDPAPFGVLDVMAAVLGALAVGALALLGVFIVIAGIIWSFV